VEAWPIFLGEIVLVRIRYVLSRKYLCKQIYIEARIVLTFCGSNFKFDF
jgi:hypothetical protein